MGHRERRKREKENLKQKILESALKIASEDGWEKVTVRDISNKIEYTTSVIYGHFRGKDEIFTELRKSGFRELFHKLEKVLSQNLNPEDKLLNLSLISWDFACDNPELYKLMFTMGKPTDMDATKSIALVKDVIAEFTGKRSPEVELLVLNWSCLRHGCINLMQMADTGLDQREVYKQFILRFISSIK